MLMLAGIRGKTKAEKMHTCWSRLQKHIDSLFDSEPSMKVGDQAAEKCPGIKQKLEKKKGVPLIYNFTAFLECWLMSNRRT